MNIVSIVRFFIFFLLISPCIGQANHIKSNSEIFITKIIISGYDSTSVKSIEEVLFSIDFNDDGDVEDSFFNRHFSIVVTKALISKFKSEYNIKDDSSRFGNKWKFFINHYYLFYNNKKLDPFVICIPKIKNININSMMKIAGININLREYKVKNNGSEKKNDHKFLSNDILSKFNSNKKFNRNIKRVFFIVGHGLDKLSIVGLDLDQFKELISGLSKIGTNLLYLESCYGSGSNSKIVTKGLLKDLEYTVVFKGITNVPVFGLFYPGTTNLSYKLFLFKFFRYISENILNFLNKNDLSDYDNKNKILDIFSKYVFFYYQKLRDCELKESEEFEWDVYNNNLFDFEDYQKKVDELHLKKCVLANFFNIPMLFDHKTKLFILPKKIGSILIINDKNRLSKKEIHVPSEFDSVVIVNSGKKIDSLTIEKPLKDFKQIVVYSIYENIKFGSMIFDGKKESLESIGEKFRLIPYDKKDISTSLFENDGTTINIMEIDLDYIKSRVRDKDFISSSFLKKLKKECFRVIYDNNSDLNLLIRAFDIIPIINNQIKVYGNSKYKNVFWVFHFLFNNRKSKEKSEISKLVKNVFRIMTNKVDFINDDYYRYYIILYLNAIRKSNLLEIDKVFELLDIIEFDDKQEDYLVPVYVKKERLIIDYYNFLLIYLRKISSKDNVSKILKLALKHTGFLNKDYSNYNKLIVRFVKNIIEKISLEEDIDKVLILLDSIKLSNIKKKSSISKYYFVSLSKLSIKKLSNDHVSEILKLVKKSKKTDNLNCSILIGLLEQESLSEDNRSRIFKLQTRFNCKK